MSLYIYRPTLSEQDRQRAAARQLLEAVVDGDRRAPCPGCGKRLRPYVATTWPHGPYFRQHRPCGPTQRLEPPPEPTLDLPDYGVWDAEDVRRLVEATIALHAAVWPHGEVDGDGDPASIVLDHAEATRAQVAKLRELAVEVARYAEVGLTTDALKLLDDLDDHLVTYDPEAGS